VDDGPAVQVQGPVLVVAQVPVAVPQVWPLGQPAQVAPPFPHEVLLWLAKGTQAVPLQQPFGHELALQAHLPAEQAVPVPQTAQLAPAVPQVALLEVWHLPLESQQPFGHELALQTHLPPLQAWPVAQAPQDAPPVPQLATLWLVTQVVPLQQPVHELLLQAHWPFTQA
jgi:hypothetical protein